MLLCMLCLITALAGAQGVPERMNFQAVVRDASENLLTNAEVGVRITIRQGVVNLYVETHSVRTNANGLITLSIGGGTVVSGEFSSIDWSADQCFVKTDIDPAGGTDYTISGEDQLLSVPYAMYAKSAGNTSSDLAAVATSGSYNDLQDKPEGTAVGDLLYWNGTTWVALPIGMDGDMLAVVDGKLAWIEPSFTNPSATTYKLGDVFYEDGVATGVVTNVSTVGRFGYVLSFTQIEDAAWSVEPLVFADMTDDNDGLNNLNSLKMVSGWTTSFPGFAQVIGMGDGWYVPSLNELKSIYENKTLFNKNAAAVSRAETPFFLTLTMRHPKKNQAMLALSLQDFIEVE